MSAITDFLSSSLGKISIYLFVGGILVSIVLGIVKIYGNTVESKALATFNSNQLKQALEDRDKFDETIKQLKNDQAKILSTLQEQNKQVKSQSDKINAFLGSKEALDKDGPTDDIMKETLRRLKEGN